MGTSVWGVRGTPVDQDSTPPATGPTQDPIVSTNAVPSAIPPSVQSSGPHAEAPTAASLMSVPNEGLASPHAVPVPVGSLTVLRSTPVDWGSPAQAPTPPLPPTSATAPVAASTMQPVRPDATTGLAVPSISGGSLKHLPITCVIGRSDVCVVCMCMCVSLCPYVSFYLAVRVCASVSAKWHLGARFARTLRRVICCNSFTLHLLALP